MIFLSIVIPSYKAESTIIPLLASISASSDIQFSDIETIVVDDSSPDRSIERMKQYIYSSAGKKFDNLKIIQLKKNSGPAVARNIGVKYATGRFVLFLDSDVVLHRDTLAEVIRSFYSDPDLFAMTGVWDKKQKSNKFFQKFKALRDWSYWINERDPRNYYYLFSTRIAAIDRNLFLRLGGFDTTYKAALVEDIELTYRIARRYAVVFNPKARVYHEFEDFAPIAKKYFWRSYYWSKIYRERKKFDPVATTGKEAMTTITAGLVPIGILLGYLSYLGNLGWWTTEIILATELVLLLHLWGIRKFLAFCIKEEGVIFALKAAVTGFVLYLIILAGAAWSFVDGIGGVFSWSWDIRRNISAVYKIFTEQAEEQRRLG